MASPSGPKWLDVYDTPYSNASNTAANPFLLTLICASLVVCVGATWRTRRCVPFGFVMCVAYVFEIAAYALRFQPWDYSRFSTEVGLFTIAPVFITIGIHLCTAEVLTLLGAEHAPLFPNAHLRIFVWTDLAALLLQGVGLALTFSGGSRAAGPWGLLLAAQAHPGQTVLFAGLLLHALALACALACLLLAYASAGRADRRRYGHYATATAGPDSAHQQHQHQGGPPRRQGRQEPLPARLKAFLAVLPLAATCVLVRCAYRAAAAWGGLGSPIARDAVVWLVAEGVLLTEAMVTLAVFHPGMWLGDSGNSSGSSSGTRQHQHQHDDVEGGAGGLARPSVVAQGKRLSSGTTLSMAGGGGGDDDGYDGMDDYEMDDVDEKLHHHHHHHHHRGRPLRHGAGLDAAGAGQGLLSPTTPNLHLMAPSEAGSSSSASGSPSRRGSAALLDGAPYYHFEDVDAPYDPHPQPLRLSRYDDNNNNCNIHSDVDNDEDNLSLGLARAGRIDAETRGLSPLEAEAEADRALERSDSLATAPEPPRKSSKRMSRVLSGQEDADDDDSGSSDGAAAAAAAAAAAEEEEVYDDFDVESFVEPPRKSSKRMSRVLAAAQAIDSSSNTNTNNNNTTTTGPATAASFGRQDSFTSSARTTPAPSRTGTLRVPSELGDDDAYDERLEVGSIVLPPRKPSKRDTIHGGGGGRAGGDDEEDLDAGSMYSQ